jgi:glycosyltransferase involved in cell wall biosynthesis
MKQTISVLIPVYNRKHLVTEAVSSALSQDYPSLEVVISDNCSTDGTWDECLRLYGDNPRVLLVRNSENLGPVPNWLVAAKAARGTYVKFLFSDDLLLPGCLSELSSCLSDDVGFVYSACLTGESVGNSKCSYLPPNPWGGRTQRLSAKFGLLLYAAFAGSRVPVSPGSAIFRRKDAISSLENSICRPASHEALLTGAGPDLNLFLDALNAYPAFVAIRRPLCFFRSHPGSFTTGNLRPSVLMGYSSALLAFFGAQPIIYRCVLNIFASLRALRRKFAVIVRPKA